MQVFFFVTILSPETDTDYPGGSKSERRGGCGRPSPIGCYPAEHPPIAEPRCTPARAPLQSSRPEAGPSVTMASPPHPPSLSTADKKDLDKVRDGTKNGNHIEFSCYMYSYSGNHVGFSVEETRKTNNIRYDCVPITYFFPVLVHQVPGYEGSAGGGTVQTGGQVSGTFLS